MQTKRTIFPNKLLPYAAAGAAARSSRSSSSSGPRARPSGRASCAQDAFGLAHDLRRVRELPRGCLPSPTTSTRCSVTAVFAVSRHGAVDGRWRCSWRVAVDRLIRGSRVYTTLLVWPYAVAPAVAGILWWFMFNPTIGILPYVLGQLGYDWNHRVQPARRHDPRGHRRELEADQLQLPVLPRRPAVDPRTRCSEAAAIDGAGPVKRFWTIVFPLLSPTTFFLLVVNIVYAMFDTFGVIDATTEGGPAQAHQHPRLQGLPRRLRRPQPRLARRRSRSS